MTDAVRLVDERVEVVRVSTGYPGIPGASGADGADGVDGNPGAPGAPGADGADGAPGADGREVEFQASATHIQWRRVGDVAWVDLVTLESISGADGAPGADGADGTPGVDGADGAPGADGDPGAPGADGADGVDGKSVLSGAGAPVSGFGVDGDFYIDTSAVAIYGPKAAGAWGSATSLVGPGGGGSDAGEVRSANDGTYDYTGTAASGTGEGSSGWTVTRITLTSPPVVETGTGTWTGRAGLTYS